MDIKQYIGTGILEDYVLGITSEQEQREVQCLSKIYPEIASHIAEIQDEFADAIMADAVTPPQGLKAKILDNLPDREESDLVAEAPQPVLSVVKDETTNEKASVAEESKTRFPWGMAAAFVLILGLGGMYFNAMTNVSSQENEILDLRSENGLAQQRIDELSTQKNTIAADLAFVTSPTTQAVQLGSVAEGFEANAVVYWNPETKEVFFETANMPALADGMQYQLWTIADGAPVSQGVIPLEDEEGLEKMQPASQAQAFAISLEPLGGSETPTEVLMVGAIEG